MVGCPPHPRLARLTLAGLAGWRLCRAVPHDVRRRALYQGASWCGARAVAVQARRCPAPRPAHALACGPRWRRSLSYGLYLWHGRSSCPDPRPSRAHRPELGAAHRGHVGGRHRVLVVEQPCRHGLSGIADRCAGWGSARPAVAIVLASSWSPWSWSRRAAPARTTRVPAPGPSRHRTAGDDDDRPPGAPLPAVPRNGLRVMVGGDSQAWSLCSRWTTNGPRPRHRHAHGRRPRLHDHPGRGLVDGVEHAKRCDDWPSTWKATAFDFQPDVVVAMWGRGRCTTTASTIRALSPGPRVRSAYEQALADHRDAGRGGPDTASSSPPCRA